MGMLKYDVEVGEVAEVQLYIHLYSSDIAVCNMKPPLS